MWPLSSRPVLLILALLLALAFTVARDTRQISAQTPSCGITEITFTPAGASNLGQSTNGDGTRIAFQSNRDYTGDNADANHEIFLYDAVNGFTQVTDTTGASIFNINPSISSDGTRIAFASNGDLTGGNADGNREIFLYDSVSGITQVTHTIGGSLDTDLPSISNDGTYIAFESLGDLAGSNADANKEIFLYNVVSTSLTQVTQTTGGGNGNSSPSINGDGTRIAFVSDRDLTGGNADGNREIFLYDTGSGYTQITFTTGGINGNHSPSISGDGTRIAFRSDLYPAGNPAGNLEIFVYDSTTGGLAEITFTDAGFNVFPSISDDGARIAFHSTSDLVGENADGNFEIFLYDAVTSSFTQVTDTTLGYSSDASISGDGTRIAFGSTSFANLGNADGNSEIFLASCLSPQPASSADLSVSLGVDKSSVKQGALLTYTITVSNFGPNDAVGVAVNDALSSGTTFVKAHANKGNLTTPPVGQSGVVTWNVGDVLTGGQEAAQIQVTVIVRGKITVTNTATVNSATGDPNEENNTASITTSVTPGGKK